jgi:hypothetical protein
MLNQDIPEEFYIRVELVARQFQRRWDHLEWEDIRQEVWLWLVENRPELGKAVDDPTDANLRKITSQVCARLTHEDNSAWGRYEYGTKHVRAMLESGFLHDYSMGTLSERHDFDNGLMELAVSNPNYWDVIQDRYFHNGSDYDTTKRSLLTRAVDKLTKLMNQFRVLSVEDYTGIGSDKYDPPFDVIEDMFGGDKELYYSNMH